MFYNEFKLLIYVYLYMNIYEYLYESHQNGNDG